MDGAGASAIKGVVRWSGASARCEGFLQRQRARKLEKPSLHRSGCCSFGAGLMGIMKMALGGFMEREPRGRGRL